MHDSVRSSVAMFLFCKTLQIDGITTIHQDNGDDNQNTTEDDVIATHSHRYLVNYNLMVRFFEMNVWCVHVM